MAKTDADVRIGADLSPMEQALRGAQSKLQSWGRGLARIGAGTAAAGAAITAPFMHGLSVFSEMASEITTAARVTGMSFSEVQAMAAGTRLSFEELIASTGKMSSFLDDAFTNPASAAARTLRELGLSATALSGMSQSERMLALADAISRVTDEGRRLALQREIFGRGGGMMNITGGAAGIATRAAATATDRMRPEDESVAKEYNAAMKKMGAATKSFWATLGAIAAPALMPLIQAATEIIRTIRDWANSNREVLGTIFRIGGILVAVGSVLASFGGGMIGLATAAGFIAMGISALIPMLPIIGIVALAIIGLGAQLTAVVLIFRNQFAAIFSYAMETFGGIVDALSAGEITLAFQIAIASIKLLWIQGMAFLKNKFLEFVFEVQSGLHQLAEALGFDISAPQQRIVDPAIEQRARAERDALLDDAAYARFLADSERWARMEGAAGRAGTTPMLGGGNAFGSFSAGALSGFGVVSRAEQIADAQRELQEDMLAVLQEIRDQDGGIATT